MRRHHILEQNWFLCCSSLQSNAGCSIHVGAKHIFWKLSKFMGWIGTTSGTIMLTHNWALTPDTCLWRNGVSLGICRVKRSSKCYSTGTPASHISPPWNSPTAAGDSQPARHLIGLQERCKHLSARLVFRCLCSAFGCIWPTKKKQKLSVLLRYKRQKEVFTAESDLRWLIT